MNKALEKAYKMEKRALLSRDSDLLEPIPFYWEFEEFCKNNNINCQYDFVHKEYILSPNNQIKKLRRKPNKKL